jgi:hypothetical protein
MPPSSLAGIGFFYEIKILGSDRSVVSPRCSGHGARFRGSLLKACCHFLKANFSNPVVFFFYRLKSACYQRLD